jgi:PmbA protein
VIFEPWVVVEFLELIRSLLSSEEVQKGRSLLSGRLGRRVASPLVTLRDDPRLLGGPASAAYDDEGVPTQNKTLIEGGLLRSFFSDQATAQRVGALSNGCGFRGAWSEPPAPAASNFIFSPGQSTREEIIRDTRDGLLVLEILGTHMADPVSGEFSVGISGLEIRQGIVSQPFKGAMISGNLLDFLARIDAVADDLSFHGLIASPTVRVSALDVA